MLKGQFIQRREFYVLNLVGALFLFTSAVLLMHPKKDAATSPGINLGALWVIFAMCLGFCFRCSDWKTWQMLWKLEDLSQKICYSEDVKSWRPFSPDKQHKL